MAEIHGEIHAYLHTTLDGVVQGNGGPNEVDAGFPFPGWDVAYRGADSGAQIVHDIQQGDALLLGRRTFDIWRPYWPHQSDPIADVFNAIPKYVASRGEPDLGWEGTTQVRDPAAEVPAIRDRHAQVHVWGSAGLLQTLFAAGLVDQLNLWVYPIVLGVGIKVFPHGATPTRFAPAEPARSFESGLTLLRYRRLDGVPESVTTPA